MNEYQFEDLFGGPFGYDAEGEVYAKIPAEPSVIFFDTPNHSEQSARISNVMNMLAIRYPLVLFSPDGEPLYQSNWLMDFYVTDDGKDPLGPAPRLPGNFTGGRNNRFHLEPNTKGYALMVDPTGKPRGKTMTLSYLGSDLNEVAYSNTNSEALEMWLGDQEYLAIPVD